MGLIQQADPSTFAGLKTWDVRDVDSNAPVPSGRPVGRRPGFYALPGGNGIDLNPAPSDPVVRRRTCAAVDVRCNFWNGDAVLVARDPNPSMDSTDAPLKLVFSSPIKAVGAWLAVTPRDIFDQAFFGQPLWGHLWVALASDPASFIPFGANGNTGDVLVRPSPITAPFVGVRATGADRIVEARFDASLVGSRQYDALVLSELSFEA